MANTGSVRCLASNTFFTATFVNIEVSPRQCLGIHLIGRKAALDTIHLNQSTLRSLTRRTISTFLRTGTDIPGLLMTYGSTAPSTGQWNWMGGSPTTDDIAGVYGTQGVAGAGDTPGQRDLAVSWIDGSGNFWRSEERRGGEKGRSWW